eukprot:653221-Pyramimonas_sp.AAC.1
MASYPDPWAIAQHGNSEYTCDEWGSGAEHRVGPTTASTGRSRKTHRFYISRPATHDGIPSSVSHEPSHPLCAKDDPSAADRYRHQ